MGNFVWWETTTKHFSTSLSSASSSWLVVRWPWASKHFNFHNNGLESTVKSRRRETFNFHIKSNKNSHLNWIVFENAQTPFANPTWMLSNKLSAEFLAELPDDARKFSWTRRSFFILSSTMSHKQCGNSRLKWDTKASEVWLGRQRWDESDMLASLRFNWAAQLVECRRNGSFH